MRLRVLWGRIIGLMLRHRFCGLFGRIIELVDGSRRRMWGAGFISLGRRIDDENGEERGRGKGWREKEHLHV